MAHDHSGYGFPSGEKALIIPAGKNSGLAAGNRDFVNRISKPCDERAA